MSETWEALRDPLQKLVQGRDLTATEAGAALSALLSGEATAVQVGALLGLIKVKGAAAAELAGFVSKIAERMAPIDLGVRPEVLVDLGGSGSDRNTVSPVYAASAVVAVAAGVKCVTAISRGGVGGFGTADALALLGVHVDAPLPAHQRCMQELGVAFVQADRLSPFLSQVEPLHRELGFRTILDQVASIASPFGARRQVLGVTTEGALDATSQVLKRLQVQFGIAVCGLDATDEITVSAKSKVAEVTGGQIEVSYVQPESFGLRKWAAGSTAAKTAEEAALQLSMVFQGQPCALRDAVVLNAALAIRAGGFASSYEKGVEVAKRCLASGRPTELLERLIRITVM
jgi:anthranilate phosphoribosyltransferase